MSLEYAEETAADVLGRIQALLPSLSGAMRRVAEHLLSDLPSGARSGIVQLAEASGTSPATVTRFCRALGFDGYSQLRLQIAMETGRAVGAGWDIGIGHEFAPGDSIDAIAGVVANSDLRAIRETVGELNLASVELAAARIATARRIDIYGVGNSATVASELHLRLHRIGLFSWSWSDVHDGLASAALLGPDDVALAISHSGSTTETFQMLSEAADRGATTVALTSFPAAPIAVMANVVLTTAVYETTFRPGSVAARHSQLTVVDLIYVAVAQRVRERAAEALAGAARAVAGHRVDPAAGRPASAGNGTGAR